MLIEIQSVDINCRSVPGGNKYWLDVDMKYALRTDQKHIKCPVAHMAILLENAIGERKVLNLYSTKVGASPYAFRRMLSLGLDFSQQQELCVSSFAPTGVVKIGSDMDCSQQRIGGSKVKVICYEARVYFDEKTFVKKESPSLKSLIEKKVVPSNWLEKDTYPRSCGNDF